MNLKTTPPLGSWMSVALSVLLLVVSTTAMAAEPPHAAWTALLQKHVVLVDSGHGSRVDYSGMQQDSDALTAYTHALSGVSEAQFKNWNTQQQMAFLINAYNAFTVQLILTKWPHIDSIKDLGSLFSSPWKKQFFSLLGQRTDLDAIEHRLRHDYHDPRIHFAINCASISCPMLARHAYVGAKLDQQLDRAAKRFLRNREDNHYQADSNTLHVSKIFDWYKGDFKHSHAGSARAFLAAHAKWLADMPAEQQRIAKGKFNLEYLDYDWSLNASAKH